jgi:hypothetical protein
VVFVARAREGSCRSAVELVQITATLSSICTTRRCILAGVKFLSRLLTVLNLLPSIATLASAKSGARSRFDLIQGLGRRSSLEGVSVGLARAGDAQL